jgi:hypothetical protein
MPYYEDQIVKHLTGAIPSSGILLHVSDLLVPGLLPDSVITLGKLSIYYQGYFFVFFLLLKTKYFYLAISGRTRFAQSY